MNPELLLQHFDRISDAPDSVARLRRFILDMAVRGKLVEQDPNDEPAVELLKQIQVEKARLVKGGSGRKEKSSALLAGDELAFPIPKGWQWSQLAEIGFISPRNDVVDSTPASFVPMTLISAAYGIPHKHEVRPWSEIKTGYTHFAEGDVGLAKITPCFENGKSTVFRSLTGGFGAGTTELHVVRPLLVDAEYVLLFLKCPHFIDSGTPRMTGTAGQKRVPADYFAHSSFPLPPLAEQHRIVAKVDELMALCDQLEAAQNEREAQRDRLVAASLHSIGTAPGTALPEAARFHLDQLPRLTTRPEHIKQLRQAILNLAVRGRLVPQDPKDEPAVECLTRLGLKCTALPGNGAEADDLCLHISWKPVRFEDVAIVTGGVTLGRKLGERKVISLPYLRVANVKRGELDLGVVKEVSIAESELERYALRENDLLMTEGGDWDKVGRAAIWRGEIPCCLHQNHIFRARMRSPEITPRWFELYFNSPTGRGYFESASKQTTNLASINMRQVRGCSVPLPPFAEQHRIVAKVDELMALCDQLEAQLTTTQTDSRRLLEAVLRDALAPTLAEAA